MIQLFHPVFRHLWYLTGLAFVGLFVLGYAYEKLSGNTSGIAILGFTASIIHASAWWFTMGPASPWKKFLACLLLFLGALLSAFAGRFAFQLVVNQPVDLLIVNLKFIAGIIPVWWLSLVIVNRVLKEVFRWRLNFADSQISPRTSLADMFQLTAIMGAVIAFSSPTAFSLLGTDYTKILLVSMMLNVGVMIPLSLIILKSEMASPAWTSVKAIPFIVLLVLGLVAFSKLLTTTLEGVADVALGLIALVTPLILMLLMTRENMISLSSGWFDQDVEREQIDDSFGLSNSGKDLL